MVGKPDAKPAATATVAANLSQLRRRFGRVAANLPALRRTFAEISDAGDFERGFNSLGLLFFGAIGACGVLLFGITAFSLALGTADADGLSGAFLIIGLPSLLVGLVGLMWFIWFLRVLISKDSE